MMTNKQGGDKRSTQLWDLDSTLPCSRLSGNPRHQIIIVMTKTTKTKTNPRHQIIIVNCQHHCYKYVMTDCKCSICAGCSIYRRGAANFFLGGRGKTSFQFIFQLSNSSPGHDKTKTTRNRKKGMNDKYNKGKDKGRLRAEAKASSSEFGG